MDVDTRHLDHRGWATRRGVQLLFQATAVSERHGYGVVAQTDVISYHETRTGKPAKGRPVQKRFVVSATRYGYDLANRLTAVVDDNGWPTTIKLTTCSAPKTRMSDPDMGEWSCSYYKAGNLWTQDDPDGKPGHLHLQPANAVTTHRRHLHHHHWNYYDQAPNRGRTKSDTYGTSGDVVTNYYDQYDAAGHLEVNVSTTQLLEPTRSNGATTTQEPWQASNTQMATPAA